MFPVSIPWRNRVGAARLLGFARSIFWAIVIVVLQTNLAIAGGLVAQATPVTQTSVSKELAPAVGPELSTPPPATWQQAVSPRKWSFPSDHGAHPAFKTEWWYFTGNLHDSTGRPFGFELALFRQGLQISPAQKHSKWAIRDFYFANFAISDIRNNTFLAFEKLSRGVMNESHAALGKMDTAVGTWSVAALNTATAPLQPISTASFESPGASYELHATAENASLDLITKATKPIVFEGVDGLSQKANEPGQASYYYSYPRLNTTGTLAIGGKNYAVSGQSWFDHEFSTSSMGKGQVGWDWFCIQLDNNTELMLYLMRDQGGGIDPASQGTFVHADGSSEQLKLGDFSVKVLGHWHNRKSGADYPSGWEITLPKLGAVLNVQPAMADQELFFGPDGKTSGYWEGACLIQGKFQNQPINGQGYTELTGYYRPMESLK